MKWTIYAKDISKSVEHVVRRLKLLDVDVEVKFREDGFIVDENPSFALAVGVNPKYGDKAPVKVREDIFAKLKTTDTYKDLDDFSLAKFCRIPADFTALYLGAEQKLCINGKLNCCDLAVIPNDFALCKTYFEMYVVSKIYHYKKIYSISYLKLFGVEEEEIAAQCFSLSQNNVKLKYDTKYCDTVISIIDYTSKQQNITGGEKNAAPQTQPVEDAVENKEYSYQYQPFLHSDARQSDLCLAVCQALTKKYANEIYCYEDISLQQTVVELLTLKNKMVSLAESVTGGLAASKLVEIPGASTVLMESAVTYTNAAKIIRLGVKDYTLEKYTAVSEHVARQMAEGALRSLKTDFALSVTGYAQTENSLDLRDDLCYICIAGAQSPVSLHSLNIKGERNEVREILSNCALFYLLKYLRTN